jgi:hypothetical protein
MTKFLNNADVKGYVSQTAVTSSLLKTDADGKLVAAVAGTDYNAPGVTASAGTLVREIRNTTGATLTKGTVIYISGATGNKPTVSKALATGDSTSAQTFGLCQTDIANNSNGNVVVIGDITGINTSAFTEGAQLYLSSTTAGTYTTTKQLAPNHLVYIGVVTRSHPTQGQIEVKIQNGYELDEIHDVSISSLANNQGLFYESATDLWKNKTIAAALGYTPADDAAVVKLTGNQTVAGIKTFTSVVNAPTLSLNGGVLEGNNIVSMRSNPTGGQFRIEKSDGSLSAYPFYIGVDGTALAYYYNAAGALKVLLHTDGTSYFGNSLSVGYTTYGATSYKLDVNGTANFVGAITGTSATFSSVITATGNAASSSAAIFNNENGASGTAQYYADFKAGTTVIGRILRGNGVAGYESNGLNFDNYAGMLIKLNSLGGSGGGLTVVGGATTLGAALYGTSAIFSSTVQIGYNQVILTPSYTGYSAAYKVLAIGTGVSNTNVSINYDPSGNAGGEFNGTGQIFIAHNKGILAPNAANTNYIAVLRPVGTGVYFGGGMSSGEVAGNGLFISTSGNSGFGLTNPQSQIHLNGTITLSEPGYDTVRLHKIEHQHSDGSSANNNLRFLVSDGSGITAEKMRIRGDGNVGIGTTSPSKTLHVYTTGNEGIFLQGTGGGVWMNIQSAAGNLWSIGAQNDGMGVYNRTSSLYAFFIKDNRQLQISGYTSATSYTGTAAGYLAFDSSGNVITVAGVAATDNTKLPLAGGTMTGIIAFSNLTGNKIDFYYSGEDRYGIQVQSSELRIHSGAQGATTGGITFGKSTSTTFTEYLRIRNDGNIQAVGSLWMATSGTSYIRMGQFPVSTSNSGEAWIGRASDRSTGSMTVQLGGGSNASFFEVVDYGWTTVTLRVGMNDFSYKGNAVLHAGNYSSYALPLTGGTLSGGITFTAPGGSVLLKHAVSEVDAWIFQENAANWGLYWKNAPTGQHTFGGYTSVGAELVGMSAANSSGNGVLTSNFVGATTAYAQWMISNYTGYIWSASTIYAATSMVVGGNIVIHAGNIGSQSVSYASNAGAVGSVGIGSLVRKDATGQYLKPYYEYGSYIENNAPSTLASQMGGGGMRVDFMGSGGSADGSWSHVITFSGYNRYSMSQIGTNYNTTNARLYYRQTNNHDDAWASWKQFAFHGQDVTFTTVTSSGSVYGNDVYTTGGWFRNHTSNNGIYWSNTGWHIYPQGSSDMGMRSGGSTAAMQMMTSGGTTRGYFYVNDSNQIGILTNDGNWGLRVNSNRETNLHGNLVVNYGGSSSSIYMTDSDEGMREIHCNSNRIGFLNQSSSWGAWCDDSGNWYASAFYDSNNGGYYLDPDGASNLLYIQMPHRGNGTPNILVNNGGSENWGAIHIGGGSGNLRIGKSDAGRSWSGRVSLAMHVGANESFRVHSDGWDSLFEVWGSSGYGKLKNSLEVGGSFGTNSRSSASQATISRTFAPQGAANGYNAGGITAAIKIRLPFRANDCMWSMKVRIYNYTNDATSEYTIGNYSYSAGSYHRGAYFMGGVSADPKTVRFGNDGSYDCVWIGETTTSWSYPQVSVIDFVGGYVRSDVSAVSNNWDITFVTSFNTVAEAINPQIRFSDVTAVSVNAPSGYVSNGNPWGTANSAFFPNGITTAGGTNWIYGSMTFIGNAPSNGAGHHFTSGGDSRHTGTITPNYIGRPSHSTGYLVGSYNNIGGNSANTNPIYTIGSNYMPSDTSLGGMYGIGYSHPNFWGSGKVQGWGLYVCSNGSIDAIIGGDGSSTSIWAKTDIVAYSDSRVKENVEVIPDALDKVKSLRGVTFTRNDVKDKTKRSAGVIAQEVLAVHPEVVSGTEEDMYSVAYGNMAGLFIQAIKEQQVQVESQNTEIAELKELIKQLLAK